MAEVTDKDREAARGCYDGPGDTGLLNITLAIATARADGYREGLERAAVRLDELSKQARVSAIAWMESGDDDDSDAAYAAAAAYEDAAAAIRALAKEGER